MAITEKKPSFILGVKEAFWHFVTESRHSKTDLCNGRY